MNENKFVETHNKMKLEKHLKRCTWGKVNQEFIKEGYEGRYTRAFKKAFYELKKKQSIPNSKVINLYEDEMWAYYSHSKNEEDFIEMFLIPWSECPGMDVIIEKGVKMSSPKIVMHCLWSMTYFGFNETQIKRRLTNDSEL
ncbi:MAG: hypothetical protein LBD76_02700 [Prevotellaceae bacterium]|nr:hypothetical protein [Prevotellaceae bacterium]